MNKTLIPLILCTLAACVNPQGGTTPLEGRVVDSTFFQGALTTGDRKIKYAVGISELNGKYVVCAAINGIKHFTDRRALGAFDVTINGRTLTDGIRWGSHYQSDQELVGRQANCKLTSEPVVAGAEFDLVLRRTRF